MSAALLIYIILWCSVAGVGFIAWQRGPAVLTGSLREGTVDFVRIVPRIALGVIGSRYIAAVIPQEIITAWLGIGQERGAGRIVPEKLGTLRALIVDDNAGAREIIDDLLKGVVAQADAAASAAGMDAWLTKPVSPRVLADVLARVKREMAAGV